jgi:hypothetical protein
MRLVTKFAVFCRTWKDIAGLQEIVVTVWPVYWTQLSRFYPKTETESSLRNVVFLKETERFFKNRQDDG